MTQRLLVVDDEPGIRAVVRAYAARAGFEVLEAADGAQAATLVEGADPPDVVVLDLMIPKIDGWELCRRWRAAGGPPVVMLTARDAEAERVAGLTIGADDYVVKPFSPLELMARVAAVLRRWQVGAAQEPDVLRRGVLRIDLGKRRAAVDGVDLELTRRELDLLAALARAGDRVSRRVDLLRVLGEGEVAATERAVDQHIVNLRRALAVAGGRCRIESVRGIGYRLRCDE